MSLASQQQIADNAIIAKYGEEGKKYVALMAKIRGYGEGWGYDDVAASKDSVNLNGFMDKILAVNTDAYSDASVTPNYTQMGQQLDAGTGRIAGMGLDYQKQLAISAGKYAPEWQRNMDQMKYDQNNQAKSANQQYMQNYNQMAQQQAQSGIQGGRANAAVKS
jgi:hypothetical protein